MVFVKGLIAHAALPLALAAVGSGLLAQAETRFDNGRAQVRHAMHVDWRPDSNAPRSSGQIACWQQRDSSVRESEVAEDYQGNIYVQDPHTSQLRVVRLKPGFSLQRDNRDWMSRKLTDDSSRAEHLP